MSGDAKQIQRQRSAASASLVFFLVFLSGVAALAFEVSWSRLIGVALGNTSQSAALVLAAYFTGLAMGQYLGGLLARQAPPLLSYGLAELTTSVLAFLVPSLLRWIVNPASSEGWACLRDAPEGRAIACFLLLVAATIPLGTTLPLMLHCLAIQESSRSRGALAYCLNTVGGLAGVATASGFLLVTVGVAASGFLAAALSAVCGLTACAAAATHGAMHLVPVMPSSSADVGSLPSRAWLSLAAISGFGTLALEILFLRMFALIFHNSVYTFGAVVAAFLLALSFGSAVADWLVRRFSPRLVAAASLAAGGIALAVSVTAFPYVSGLNYFASGTTFAAYLAGTFSLVALFVLPPVTLVGVVLPAGILAASGGAAGGRLTAASTLAAGAGALVAGFVLPLLVGLGASFGVLTILFVLSGAAMLARERHTKLAAGLAFSGFAAAAAISVAPSSTHNDTRVDIVRRWETTYGWLDIVRSRTDGSLEVRQNLHYRHGSTATAIREYRQGRLPLLLHREPEDVAFLGLGTGLTAAPSIADKDVKRAVVIELIPEVVEASRLLKSANLGLVDHAKVSVYVDDARHHLRDMDRRYDVIVSDLFVPWETRAGYLYTAEFYQVVRQRLKPGGLFCQWVALYQFGPEQLEMVADTFSSVFPNTTLWWGHLDPNLPIVAIIRSDSPISVEPARLKERMEAQHALPGGADPHLRVPADVPALFLGGWEGDLRRPLNTDEHPRLEFESPVSHRSGHTLHGRVLRKYFDAVLSRLPSSGVRFGGQLSELINDGQRRRAIHRLSLFGDEN